MSLKVLEHVRQMSYWPQQKEIKYKRKRLYCNIYCYVYVLGRFEIKTAQFTHLPFTSGSFSL